MTNLHLFWLNCLHCPLLFVVGIGIVVVAFSSTLVSIAAQGCKSQAQPLPPEPETKQNTLGCEPNVLHVVF